MSMCGIEVMTGPRLKKLHYDFVYKGSYSFRYIVNTCISKLTNHCNDFEGSALYNGSKPQTFLPGLQMLGKYNNK